MSEIVSFIVSKIESCIDDALSAKFKEFANKKKRNDFLKQLAEKISHYCNANQSSYLNSGAFSDFWNYSKPCEKIIHNSLDVKNPLSFESLLPSIITEAKDCAQQHKLYWTTEEERTVKDLCALVNNEFRTFISETMDDDHLFIASNVIAGNAETQKSVKAIAENEKQMYEMLNQLIEDRKLSPYKVLPILEIICRKMWNGEFEEVDKLLPLIASKVKDLEISIEIMQHLMLSDKYIENSLSDMLAKIDSCEIRDCVIRNIIPLLFFREEKLEFLENYTCSDELKQIISALESKKYDGIFTDNVVVDSGIEMHSFSFDQKLYSAEKWLLNQIFIVYVFQLKAMYSSQTIETLIVESDSSWLSELIKYDGRIASLENIMSYDQGAKVELDSLQKQVINQQELFKKLSCAFSMIYYKVLLRIVILQDQGDDSQLVSLVPKDIISTPEFKPYHIALRINQNKATFEEVNSHCKNSQNYGLLMCYLSSLENPKRILEVYESHVDIIRINVLLFAFYVNCLIQENRIEDALNVIEEYKKNYASYYEYWDVFFKADSASDNHEQFIEKCRHGEMKCLSVYSLIKLVERLLCLEQFDLAEKYNAELMIKTNNSSLTKKFQAFILNGKNKQIDALELLCSIFDEYKTDFLVVRSIISLSIQNKRRVEEKYIEAAEKLANPFSLVLASAGYSSIGNEEAARECNMKALFLSDECTNPAFNQYLGLNMHNLDASQIEHHNVESNTVAVLKDKSTNQIVKYVIHGKKDLPSSPTVWHGDIHIYKNDAARLDLYNLRVGNDVNIDGHDYTLDKIESLSSYVLKICFDNLIKSGAGKAISLPLKNGKLDMEAFANKIAEISGDDKDRPDWITQYSNFSDVPLPMFCMQRFYKASYVEFTKALLCDPSICIRDEINNNMPSNKKVILSFLSLLILEQIGVPSDILSQNDAYVTESTLLQIREDTAAIITRNAQETVASIGVRNGKPYTVETNDEIKRKLIKEAGELVTYVEKIPCIKSNKDWKDTSFSGIKMSDMIGNADYDAISIASNEGYSFVSTESFIDGLAKNEEIAVDTVCITNWLLSISIDILDLIDYVQKMFACGCINAVTEEFVVRLVTEFNASDKERQKKLIAAWENLLLAFDNADESYKPYAIEALRKLFIKLTSKEDGALWNPLISILCRKLLELRNIKIGLRINEEGKLEIGYYKEERD